jgi:hypothetical protein
MDITHNINDKIRVLIKFWIQIICFETEILIFWPKYFTRWISSNLYDSKEIWFGKYDQIFAGLHRSHFELWFSLKIQHSFISNFCNIIFIQLWNFYVHFNLLDFWHLSWKIIIKMKNRFQAKYQLFQFNFPNFCIRRSTGN